MPVKKAGKTPVLTPEMRPQPHGGALRVGGTNRGGPGRPPNEIRQALREAFANRLPVLTGFADGAVTIPLRSTCPKCGHEPDEAESVPVIPDGDQRLKAMDLLAKYGLGTTKEISVDDVRGRLERTYEAMIEEMPTEMFERVSDRMRDIWR